MSVGYIILTQGYVAMVDFEDMQYIQQWSWYAWRKGSLVYALRKKRLPDGRLATRRLHHEVLRLGGPPPRGYVVDHINHNSLDCRKENLRLCTVGENNCNRRPTRYRKTSKYKGLSWQKKNRKWRAQIRHKGRYQLLGNFPNEFDAVRAYNAAARRYHGEFAFINVWDGPTCEADLENPSPLYYFHDCLTHMFHEPKNPASTCHPRAYCHPRESSGPRHPTTMNRILPQTLFLNNPKGIKYDWPRISNRPFQQPPTPSPSAP